MIYLVILPILVNLCFGQIETPPCPDLNLTCIQNYFTKRVSGGCGYVEGVPPEYIPGTFKENYNAIANSTITHHNVTISNFITGKITGFFIDNKANLTILAFTFNAINTFIENATIQYYRPGKSPIFDEIAISLGIENLIITVYFDGIDNLNLENSTAISFIYGDVNVYTEPDSEHLAATEIGPVMKAIEDNLGEFAKQEFNLETSNFLAGTLIQYIICDFEINYYKLAAKTNYELI